jgi:hypothetical protein
MMASSVETGQRMRMQMRVVLDERGRGEWREMARRGDGQPFFVLNPDYHDGGRGSFVLLPDAYFTRLVQSSGLDAQEIQASPIGPVLTVTERAIVLTLTTARQMVHLVCDVDNVFRKSHGEDMTALFDRAHVEGWSIPAAEHEAFFDELAAAIGLVKAQWGLPVPSGVVRGKGGDA